MNENNSEQQPEQEQKPEEKKEAGQELAEKGNPAAESPNPEEKSPEKSAVSASEAPVTQKKDQGIECRYCNDEENPDRVAHLVCIEMADGHVHVHAPFADKRAIYRFLDAIEVELARHKREPEPKNRRDALK
jgi:hypothetical protein